ncbi:ABC transporter ATP-binding protein [Motiliproteus sediminis]|uniref:ABC transporter ATP-binding protein n=1 Tax=Motiliproteus sediminis TaxID=1468178 RepID=UPI001AEF5027|nr:ABC transporter ATP-binding protein [Motiliproteus sediminis]
MSTPTPSAAGIRRLFQRFGGHLRPHYGTLLLVLLFTLGVALAQLLRPWPLKLVFDALLLPDAAAYRAGWPQWSQNPELLLAALIGAIVVIAVAGGMFAYAQSYLAATVGQRVVAAIRQRLYSHLQRLSHSFHDSSSSGDLIARLTGDIQLLRELMINLTLTALDRGLVMIGVLLVMLWMDWQLALMALAVVPLLVFANRRYHERIKGATRTQRRQEGKLANVVTEKLTAIHVVQAFAREAHEDQQFSSRNANSLKAGVRATRLIASFDRLVQVLLAVGTAMVLWFGVNRVQAGTLTPGDLLVFLAYLKVVYKSAGKIASLSGRVAKATVCGERVLKIIDTRAEIRDAEDAVEAPRFRGRVRFDRVYFGYGAGRPVLNGVDLELRPGETLALIGDSGSGKSTIASLLLRFYDPEAGTVLIDDVPANHYTLTSLRDQIAVVMQDAVLFNTSIRANIGYGKLDASDEEIVAAAKAANAHHFIEALPQGYDTAVGERGALLSGGQRQRIAIARAVIRQAPILILDEPVAGLDPRARAEVQTTLEQLAVDRTCLMITHDMAAAASADRVVQLRDGVIRELPALDPRWAPGVAP